jgi:poly-gamma-glutamate capsule biosynthesis protein CapA/YwtB (metallophosphatase superfamily)
LAAAAVCVLAASWLFSTRHYERRLELANAAGLRGDYRLAIAEAGAARAGATTAGRAAAVRAYALLHLQRWRAASAGFADAVRSDPADWQLRRDWAQTLLIVGAQRAAARQMSDALALNPRMRVPPVFRVR